MGWSDWIYLGVGLGVGFASSWLWRKQQPISQEKASTDSSSSDFYELELQQVSQRLKELELAYQMASEMSQFKGGFLARTSHELRSPLNSIIGSLQLVLSNLCETPQEERQFLQNSHDALLQLITFLDDIISVSKLEHGTETMKIEPIQLLKIFEELEKLTQLQSQNNRVRLEIIKPNDQLYILADFLRFRQILVNLVDHAIAQMEQGFVRVSVEVSPQSNLVHIWLDDQRSISAWSESWDLLNYQLNAIHFQDNHDNNTHNDTQKADLVKNLSSLKLSAGMRLLMNQTLLELMNGRLEVLILPWEENRANFTRTQCSIPLAILANNLTNSPEKTGWMT